MYYTQEQIDRANQADLVSFLHGQGEQLTRASPYRSTARPSRIRVPTVARAMKMK